MVELGPPLMCRLFGHKRAKLAQMNREKGQWESGCKRCRVPMVKDAKEPGAEWRVSPPQPSHSPEGET
jgi:Prophage protein (DUF1660)